MDVLVQKVNSGVTFTPKGRGASRNNKLTAKGQAAAYEAWRAYSDDVMLAFDRAGIGNTGYARVFADAYLRFSGGGDDRAPYGYMDLEPWGFAKGSYADPLMNDSGSTPTPSRARHLLAYQAPLSVVKRKGGTYLEATYETGRMAKNPRSYHAAGFGMDYDLVSPQKARSLLTAAHGKARRLPRPGSQIRLDDHAVLTNRAGQYEVDHR
jgi:hypothetical protein